MVCINICVVCICMLCINIIKIYVSIYNWSIFMHIYTYKLGFPCGSAGKRSTYNAWDLGSIPQLGRFPGEEKGYPLQYSVLYNSMYCIVHWGAKSQTWPSDFHIHINFKWVYCIYIIYYIYYYIYICSVQSLSCVRLFATSWTAACQASLSIHMHIKEKSKY